MSPCLLKSAASSNCAQLILLHAEKRLGRHWSEEVYRISSSFYGGLGIGSLCCGLLGALCVLGLVYEEDEARRKGLMLFQAFQEEYGTLLCPRLKALTDADCDRILLSIDRILDPLLPPPEDARA